MQKPFITHSKIRGVSHNNPDGTAIAIHLHKRGLFRTKRYQLGYISSDLSNEIAPLLDQKWGYIVRVTEITGGTKTTPTLGINIHLELAPPP